ncbi:hypothetical protein [Myroides odoratimimus]|uniref:hypothetical protein n=1 Tax=Myroides odoratimimus TaxID=76832 RepID=UPI001CE225CC|nr:hypothetical protein [Myroides odoratimimus]MCA4807006.1 hypothetical protein [Myroides odoratimimus]
MKKYIQNLLVPFAVLAMLTVGAFTINASEKTDKAVNVETVIQNQADNPYSGELFIRNQDPISGEITYTKVGDVQEGDCSLEYSTERCTIDIDNMEHELWAKLGVDSYVPLYKL